MISTVRVVGTGRAGGAIAARLAERGLPVSAGREPLADADLVLLAVPDATIASVAQRVPIGGGLPPPRRGLQYQRQSAAGMGSRGKPASRVPAFAQRMRRHRTRAIGAI